MSNILNGKVQSNGLGYVKANIDDINFNNIKTKSKSVLTNLPVSPLSNANLWKADVNDLSGWTGINAVDIDWNGAEVDENTIINTTGELLSWIKNKCNEATDDSRKIDEIQNTIELYQEVFNLLLNNLLSTKYATDNFQEKGDYVTINQYNILLNKIEYLEKFISDNVNSNYYLGIATEDQIQNQSYINNLNYNKPGIKPDKLLMSFGFNIIIYPEEWGIPMIKDDLGFEMMPYTANDLGIINPNHKIILVEEMSANNTNCNLIWN